MEKQKTPQPLEPAQGLRARLHLTGARIYFWPIRTLVQLGFFLLFSGGGIMSLDPAFNGSRSWVVLPVVASIRSQAQGTSTMDAITVLLANGLFAVLPIGIMHV